MSVTGLGWIAIVRLGLVQASIGAIVMLVTSLLNRVMVVEQALPAAIPAGLVAWHYVVQLSRPRFGHGSDAGRRRTPFIIGGMGALALGGLLATRATLLAGDSPALALPLALLAYTLIGTGVGAAGTSLLALLASRTAERRRPAAAALTWILMIAGIVVTAAVAGARLDPYSPERLSLVAGCIVLAAFLLTIVAVAGIEARHPETVTPGRPAPAVPFRTAIRETWQDPAARRFSFFVVVSMLAYAMQDLILEPFAGLVFHYTPGQSTSLSSVQHMGVLLGMIAVGAGAGAFGAAGAARLKGWIIAGSLGSAMAMMVLAGGAIAGPGFPLGPAVFCLGFANGIFAVAAIATMMALAGGAGPGREGVRMGLWGGAQAIAFGAGGLLGAMIVDIGRATLPTDGQAFLWAFLLEGALFLAAAAIALGLSRPARSEAPFTREMRA